ncbi:MAG: hypothetical protein IPK71_11775 [Myxococcales bacterium]|nr:hypothetical protein [Myxococcales bacterium]
MKLSRLSFVLLASSLTVAAHQSEPEGQKPAASAAPQASTASAPQASASAKAQASAAPQASSSAAPKGKTAISKETAKAYTEALKKGRAATLAKKYDEAIAAFDAALKALPGDARALSERGYAKLLAGKLDDARKDLREAEASTKDPKLLGQIHYNHGLVAEKLGHAEEAKASVAKSNVLAPTKAAATKAGTSTCVADVETQNTRAKLAKDFQAMFDALKTEAKDQTKVGSNDEAKTGLFARIPKEAQDFVVAYQAGGEDGGGAWEIHPYLKTPDGLLFGVDTVSTYYDFPCGGDISVTTSESSGLRLVKVVHAAGMRVPVCEADGGELTGVRRERHAGVVGLQHGRSQRHVRGVRRGQEAHRGHGGLHRRRQGPQGHHRRPQAPRRRRGLRGRPRPLSRGDISGKKRAHSR